MHLHKKFLIPVFLLLFSTAWAVENIDESKLKIYPIEEFVKHGSKESCWVLLDKYIYDVTNFLDDHPGPHSILTKCCGKECTKGYLDKKIGTPHSPKADKIRAKMIIGILKEKMG